MTNRDHNRLLAIFFFIQGGLQLFGGLIAAVIYGGMGTFMFAQAHEPEAATIGGLMLLVGIFVVVLTFACAALYIFTGWKLQNLQPIGRVFGIIASVLALLGFPLGTALGIYGLWFLAGDRGKQLYADGGEYNPTPPPPPQSWQ